MAVRQYVGARYVPKFADPVAWQSGTSYEALTIVTYNNASYTSKVPVPATVGNPADNDSYWALTGNYNAQVEAYREETVAVQENLTEEIQNREQADTALQGNIDTLKNSLPNNYIPINQKWTNHKVLYLGDSFSFSGSSTEHQIPYLISHFMGIPDANFHNVAVSGAYFYGDGTGTNTFQAQLQNYTGDKEEITDIIVAGGLNDSVHISFDSNLQLAIYNFMVYAGTNYPNATVWIAYIGNALDDSSVIYGRTQDKRQFCYQQYMQSGINNGARFISSAAFALCSNVSYFGSDRLHPSDSGISAISYCLANALLAGNFDWCTAQFSIAPSFLYGVQHGAFTTLFCYYYSSLTLPPDTAFGATEVETTTLTNQYFNAKVYIPVTFQINNADGITGTYVSGAGYIMAYQNHLYVALRQMNSDGTGWLSYSPKSGEAITLNGEPVTVTIPSTFMC